MNLLMLHGFLGEGSDWDRYKPEFSGWNTHSPDLFGKDQNLLGKDFSSFIRNVNEKFPGDTALLGYSMGGRLALHLALKYPEKYQQVVLLSTQIGIFEAGLKAERHVWEKNWVDVLKTSGWTEFLKAWNAQKIFAGDQDRPRIEKNYDQAALIQAFLSFSTADHQFTLEEFKAHPGSFTWVVGERDEKYLGFLEQTKILRGNKDRYLVLNDEGHRLIFAKNTAWIRDVYQSS